MINDGRDRVGEEAITDSLLSSGEVEALLGASPLQEEAVGREEEPAVPAPESWSVLMASRRTDDAEALRSRLAAHHVDVATVRSSFRALDRIRAQRYDAVVTDLELWADGGSLLFERIEALEASPLVVFLSGRDPGGESRALRAGAAGVLLCPLSPRHVELAVHQLLDALRVPRPTSSPRNDGPSRLHHPGPHPAAVPAVVGADDGEVPWLRFLLEVQRVRREHASDESFLQSFADVAREYLGARAVGISYRKSDGLRAFLSASSPPALSALSRYLSDENSHPSAVGDWVVAASDGGGARMIFVGLPRPVWLALPVFEDDVLRVIAES